MKKGWESENVCRFLRSKQG